MDRTTSSNVPTRWLVIASLCALVGRANAESADCPEPTPRERKLLRDKKLEEWKRTRRKEASSRGERITHATLALSDDGKAIIQEQARSAGGCQASYLRVVVATSACEPDMLSEDEFHVGCCAERGCPGPNSWAYAFVDAVSLAQVEAVRRFMPETSALTVTDAQGAIKTYRRTDPPDRIREMTKALPHWGINDAVGCAEPKRESGKLSVDCSLGSGSVNHRFSLMSSGSDLTDDKTVWYAVRVEIGHG